MQANVACLKVLPEAESIRRESRALIEPVEAALRISWLPLELNCALVQRVEETCGLRAARSWIHASLLHSMKGTLLKPVVDAVTHLGFGPQHGLRRCSYGWDLFYRNTGRVECTHSDVGEATIVLRDPPAEAQAPSYLRAVAWAFEGFVLGTGGRAAKAEIVQGKHIEFSIRWTRHDSFSRARSVARVQSPKPR